MCITEKYVMTKTDINAINVNFRLMGIYLAMENTALLMPNKRDDFKNNYLGAFICFAHLTRLFYDSKT